MKTSKPTKSKNQFETLAAFAILLSILAIIIDILGVVHFKENDKIMMSDLCLSGEVVVVAVFAMLLLIAALIMSGKCSVLLGVSYLCTAATYISFCGTIIHTLYYILIWIKHSKLIDILEEIPIL